MNSSTEGMHRLRRVVEALRGRDGCPWDREQTVASLRPYLLEEVYEFFEAIDKGERGGISNELGDLLFVVTLMAQAVEDEHGLKLDAIADRAADKMIRRHPHVFGEAASPPDWNDVKQNEPDAEPSLLAGVPKGMPALARAETTGHRAAAVGFDWPDVTGVRAKVGEELGELDEAMTQGPERSAEELGDLLFATAQLARKMGLSPEWALHQATQKFIRRFQVMEGYVVQQESTLSGMNSRELEALWQTAKEETS